jgi:hypothetical protein
MADIAVPGYTDILGKHGVWIGDHTGPVSYAAYTGPNTGGDVIKAPQYGLRSIDAVYAMGYSISGNFAVRTKLSTAKGASVQSAILVWLAVTYSTGVEVLTEVAAAVNLSGESVRLMVVGG